MTNESTSSPAESGYTAAVDRTTTGLRAGLSSMLVGALLVSVGVLSTTSASDQPSCPDGTAVVAHYDVVDGVYVATSGGDNVTVNDGTTTGGTWTSTELVSAVVVKGGPGSATTTIDPALLAGNFDNSQLNPIDGAAPDILSVQFCQNQELPQALARSQTPYTVTIAARACESYTDIIANRNRNNIQEALEELGPDTNYSGGEVVKPSKEAASPQDRCTPLVGWNFEWGTGITGPTVATENLSTVTGGYAKSTTLASVPELNPAGNPTGRTLSGAVIYKLNDSEIKRAAKTSLWIQGGTKGAPLGDGSMSFGALRCATDNYNGDNVEFVRYPNGAKNIFCFAYYVTEPPEPVSITVRKELTEYSKGGTTFEFTGDTSFVPGGKFTLRPMFVGGAEEIEFVRAADVDWTVTENVPKGWTLQSLKCTTPKSGRTATIKGSTFTANLAAGDSIVCTFLNDDSPPSTTTVPDTTTTTSTTTTSTSTTTTSTTTTSTTTTTVPDTTTTAPSTTTTTTTSTTTTTVPDTTTTTAPDQTTTTTDPEQSTTTTSSTTTTEPDAPTTTEGSAPTSVSPTTTPPEVGGEVVIRTDVTDDDASANAPAALAFTGGSATPMLVFGIILLIAGATLSAVSWERRRRTA